MRPLDCKWCIHFGPEGSTWETRSPLLQDNELLECRLRSVPIPAPAYSYCANYVSEDEKGLLHGDEKATGPIWIRTHDKLLPLVPYPYGSEYNEPGYRLTPVPDWKAYLEIRKSGVEKVMRSFLLSQIDKYGDDMSLTDTDMAVGKKPGGTPEADAACSGCYQTFPESKIHLIPVFSDYTNGYITAYCCDDCWITALHKTAERIRSTDGPDELASCAVFFEGYGHYIHEFRSGASPELVRQALLFIIGELDSGKLKLRAS